MDKQTCYKCFHTLDAATRCPQCGYNNAAYAPEPHYLPPGTLVHRRYRLGAALGEGGFGITYAGFDTALDRRVAVKEFFPQGCVWRDSSTSAQVNSFSSQPQLKIVLDGKQKSLQEAKSLAKLDDIGAIVRVLDFFEENNTAYIIMEYVEGVTLKTYVKSLTSPMSAREAVTLLLPIMQALEVMHSRGFVHRDISPDNIMIPPAGNAKLLDFGAVKAVTDAEGNATEHPVVKRGFSPIELYSKEGLIGPWSDVYAMCATIFYLITGQVLPEPINRINNDETTLAALSKAAGPALQAALEHGLTVHPAKRCQTMTQQRAALEAALTAEKNEAPAASAAEPQNNFTAKKQIRRPAPDLTLPADRRQPSPDADLTRSANIQPPVLVRKEQSGSPDDNPASMSPPPKGGFLSTPRAKRLIAGTGVILLLLAAGIVIRHFLSSADKTKTAAPQTQADAIRETEITPASGTCGKENDNVTWSLDAAGVLTLSGTGETLSYPSGEALPWADAAEQIQSIRVEEGVTALGSRIFAGCKQAKTVSLPESLQTIAAFSFQSCSALTEVRIPSSVKSIAPYAFDSCRSLVSFSVEQSNSRYKDIAGVLYTKDGKTLCRVPAAIDGTFTIPDGVEEISADAFCCSRFSAVTFSKTLRSIGKYAFDECEKMQTLSVPTENQTFISENNVIFSKDKKTLVLFPMQYAEDVYTIPDTVETVAPTAFCNTNLTQIVFPASVKKISTTIVSQAQSDLTLTFLGNAPETDQLPVNTRHAIRIRYPGDAAGWEAMIAMDPDSQIEWERR